MMKNRKEMREMKQCCKFKKIIRVIPLIISVMTLGLSGVTVEVVKDPRPTCRETKFVELKLIKSLVPEIDQDNYLAMPCSVVVDGQENLFVFDRHQAEIYKFDAKGRFITKFGRVGKGPGEFGAKGKISQVYLSLAPGNKLMAQDYTNARLTLFSLDGKYLKDYLVRYRHPFQPLIDDKGFIYVPSTHDGVVDVFDEKMNLVKVLLDEAVFRKFLFFEPGISFKRKLIFPYRNIHFFLVADDKLLVYIDNASTVFILKDFKLESMYNLWPEKVLPAYKRELDETIKTCPPEGECYKYFILNIFPDNDDKKYFYVQFSSYPERDKVVLHRFDLHGKLDRNLTVKFKAEEFLVFQYKYRQLFYAFGNETLFLYKE